MAGDKIHVDFDLSAYRKAQEEDNRRRYKAMKDLFAAYKNNTGLEGGRLQGDPGVQRNLNSIMFNLSKKKLTKEGENKGLFAKLKGLTGLGGIAGKLFAGGLLFGALKAIIGASPMLQQMMKLFQFSVGLILRPIGDFIGFMLRPILLMLLRNFILPFYRDMMPRMIQLGTFIGETLTPIIKGIILALQAVGQILFGAFTFNLGMVQEGVEKLSDLIGIGNEKQDEGIHEIINVADAVEKSGDKTANAVKGGMDRIGSVVMKELHLLKSSPGLKGARANDQDIMKLFGNSAEAQGGFKKSLAILNQLNTQEALRTIGAANTNIQSRISSGAFGSIDDAMAAYFKYLRDAASAYGQSSMGNVQNSGNVTYNFYGDNVDQQGVKKAIESADEKQRATRYSD